MKHIFLILSVFIFQLSLFGQEIVVKDPLAVKEKEEYKLEVNQEGYTLYLAGLDDDDGYFIKFKDKTELENFLEKALEMFTIPITYSSQKEAEIEWTHEYLNFCSLEGSSKGNKVEMKRVYLYPDLLFVLSLVFDEDKSYKKQPRGFHGFSQNEITTMYNKVSGKDLPLVKVTDKSKGRTEVERQAQAKRQAEIERQRVAEAKRVAEKKAAEESRRKKLDALMGGFSDGDGKATGDPNASGYYGVGGDGSGGNYILGNRKTLSLPAPDYPCNEEGKVVVTITVNQSGRVITAHAGASGTTNSAPCLLKEAKKAAMNSKFNADSNAPSKQVGEIIYNFSLSD